MSLLRFQFRYHTVLSDTFMILLDDVSGYSAVEAGDYSFSLNVVLLKVSPGLKWLCKPSEAVWIKPIKDLLRQHCFGHLQQEIAKYRAKACGSSFDMKARIVIWLHAGWLRTGMAFHLLVLFLASLDGS